MAPRSGPYVRGLSYIGRCQDEIRLDHVREIALPLLEPFVSSAGCETLRRVLIIEAHSNQFVGYGEVSALSAPYYTEETLETARYVLETFLIPLAFEAEWEHPKELAARFRPIRRHYTAKCGLEAAAWDLYAKSRGSPWPKPSAELKHKSNRAWQWGWIAISSGGSSRLRVIWSSDIGESR